LSRFHYLSVPPFFDSFESTLLLSPPRVGIFLAVHSVKHRSELTIVRACVCHQCLDTICDGITLFNCQTMSCETYSRERTINEIRAKSLGHGYINGLRLPKGCCMKYSIAEKCQLSIDKSDRIRSVRYPGIIFTLSSTSTTSSSFGRR
jgi:hypothetical protein